MSSNSDAAFPVASVAMGVWSIHPVVGEHVLAHFHSVCPILVPMYIRKSGDMTEADHMR